MRPASALTVCVGISAYPAAVLEPTERPLRYLASGAGELSELFSRMWPGNGSNHICLVDSAATLSKVRELISSQTRKFDILIVYLAGHGRARGEGFEFLFHDERPQDTKVTAADLDALVSGSSAASTLFLLDACHAGQFGAETTLFKSPEPGRGRFCLTSSKADQKSWEDPFFRRSLFADALIKALTDSPEAAGRTKVVSGDLFSEVATDVARHAFGLKGSAAQEPVIFGAASEVLELTTVVSGTVPQKSLTTYETLLLRTRQIGLATACIAVLAIAATSAVTWRPAINPSGSVELRAGPKWLSPLNVGPWALRVETDAARSDLKDEDLQAALLDERGMHAWPGLGAGGTRRWADVFIDDYLNSETAARWRVRLGFADAVEHLTTMGHVIIPTPTPAFASSTEMAAEVALLEPHRSLPDVWKLQWKDYLAPGSCGSEEPAGPASDIFLTYLLSDPADYKVWIRGLAAAARTDDSIGFGQVADLVQMFTTANAVWKKQFRETVAAPGEPITAERIAARFTERPTSSEVAAMVELVSAVVARRTDLSLEAVTPQERNQLVSLMDGCSDVAVHALATLGSAGDPGKVIAWAHAREKSDQGRIELGELAAHGALPDAEITWVLDSIGFSGDQVSRRHAFVNARGWLEAIAAYRSLPTPVLVKLIDYAAERGAANDSGEQQQALRLVLGDPAAGKPPLGALIAKTVGADVGTGPLPPNDQQVEQVGLLARSGAPMTAGQREILRSILADATSPETERIAYTGEDKGEAADAIELAAGLTSTHLVAISRAVIGGTAEHDLQTRQAILNFFETALADARRFGVQPSRLQETVSAAAVLLEQDSTGGLDTAALYRTVACCAQDMAARKARIDIVVAALLRMPIKQRDDTVAGLRVRWQSEQEAELKLAIADVIIRAMTQQRP
nr:caspase family protein [Mesorhizobium intechi]